MTFFIKRSFHTSYALSRGPLAWQGWYPKDYVPGPYPVTEEERRAAAIKYGLRPEDYKPIDIDDRDFAGDYPNLDAEGEKAHKYKSINFEVRDPYEGYSHKMYYRNFGEPVPKEFMRILPSRITYTGIDQIGELNWKNVGANILIIAVFVAFGWFVSGSDPGNFRYRNPVMPKHYPYDFFRAWPYQDPRRYPITNYSFEPEE